MGGFSFKEHSFPWNSANNNSPIAGVGTSIGILLADLRALPLKEI
jgi:hypothetical protein